MGVFAEAIMLTKVVQQEAFSSGSRQAEHFRLAGSNVGRQTEAGLIQAARTGELAAFNSLVLMHQDSIYWWVYSLARDEALAEDITQATSLSSML